MSNENFSKAQIIFVERALNGGGAERVIYDIAHRLKDDRFDVRIVYLYEQQYCMEPYQIPVYSVQAVVDQWLSETIQPQRNDKIIQRPKHSLWWSRLMGIYHTLVPLSLRQRLRLSNRLVKVVSNPISQPPKSQPLGAIAPLTLDKQLSSQISLLPSIFARYWPYALGLEYILSKFQKDAVLISVMEEATIVVWLKQLLRKQVYIASLHIVESIYMPILYPDRQKCTIEEYLLRSGCLGAERTLFPSLGCKQDMHNNYDIPEEKIQVFPNPVDISRIQRLSLEPLPTINPKDKVMFVHVGRLSLQKNHALLLEAASLLIKKTKDFLIICLGEGELRQEIQKQIDEQGLNEQVILFGEVQNPYPFMSAARSLVLTSKFESFSVVLVEAMVCGAVPISVDCPYGPRDVLGGGEFGLIVPTDDPQALADAMLRIAQDDILHASMRQKGFLRSKDYDIPKIVALWENLVNNMNFKDEPSE